MVPQSVEGVDSTVLIFNWNCRYTFLYHTDLKFAVWQTSNKQYILYWRDLYTRFISDMFIFFPDYPSFLPIEWSNQVRKVGNTVYILHFQSQSAVEPIIFLLCIDLLLFWRFVFEAALNSNAFKTSSFPPLVSVINQVKN